MNDVNFPPPLAVIVADDHAMVRAGLQRIIDSERGLRVRGEAFDGPSTLKVLRETPCDLLLLDLTMPAANGAELIEQIRAEWPILPILVVSMHTRPRVVREALRAGASGFLGKDSDPEALVTAIRRVAAGDLYVEPRLADSIRVADSADAPLEVLSPRETQVLRRLGEGHTNNEIAREFGLSEKTIGTHKANLMRKLGLNNMAELIRYCDEYLPAAGPGAAPTERTD